MLATYLFLFVTSTVWLLAVRRVSLSSLARAASVKYLCCSILDTQARTEQQSVPLIPTLRLWSDPRTGVLSTAFLCKIRDYFLWSHLSTL